MLPIKRILHPTDFSPSSEHAFHLACSLARDHGSRLIVLHVEERPETVMGEFGMPPPVPVDVAQWRRKLEEIQAPPPIAMERQLNEGDPAGQILAAARDSECDLIAMGTHGHSELHDMLMGSVAEEVVRTAPCAVLTVKIPKVKTPA